MKATLAGIGVLAVLACAAPSTRACNPCYACSPVFHVPLLPAPSPCNMAGFYTWCPDGRCYGMVQGPHYYLRPPFPPFQGCLPGAMGKAISGPVQPMSHAPAHPGMPPGMMPYAGPSPYGPHPGPGMGMAPPSAGPQLPPHVASPHYGHPQAAQGGTIVFPTHPYVRSPRDFFMWRENMEDRMARDFRPNLIP